MIEVAEAPKAAQLDDLIGKYVALRDKKAQMEADHKKALAPINEVMDRLEGHVLQAITAQGVESVRTAAGTAYRTRSVSVTVADKEAFRQFVVANDAWGMADVRAAKTAVEEYREANDDIPPGLNYSAIYKLGVRRA